MSNQTFLCGSYIYAGGITPEACQKIDFHRITHLFIAFSVLEEEKGLYMPVIPAETAAGMEIIRQECTRQHAECKILLSVGGAMADHFCPAARTEENRRAFAERCALLTQQYQLDGIDLDWEFPGISHCGVSACEHCVSDFTLLTETLRRALNGKLLTSAMGSDHWNRLENHRLRDLLDYANIMTYDMDPAAHSSIQLTKNAMEGWLSAGYPPEKLLLGVPFYARSLDESYNWIGYDRLMQMKEEGAASLLYRDGQTYVLVDGAECSIDTPDTIREKAAYCRDRGFGGIFCWQETTDYRGELRKAMFDSLQ